MVITLRVQTNTLIILNMKIQQHIFQTRCFFNTHTIDLQCLTDCSLF